MKKLIFLALVCISSIAFGQSDTSNSVNINSATLDKAKQVWLLTYFRQRYPTRVEIDSAGKIVEVPLSNPMLIPKLHLALSTDGRHWMALNNNQPVWNHFVRDQFIHRGPDGVWRLVATGGDNNAEKRKQYGPSFLYATSTDLINWKVENYLYLMKDARNDKGEMAQNIWAPEYFYDETTKEYIVFWSSSFEDAGWKQSRLWYSKTRDWKTFSPAKVMFEPPYSVIDGTLIKEKGTYYLFHKEEMFGAKYGERRAIRVAKSKRVEGPYTVYNGPLNKGQLVPTITEGPSVMPDPSSKGWLLLYDYPMADKYGVSYSADLLHWNVLSDIAIPADARHGSVSRITRQEAKALIEACQKAE